MWSRGRGSWRRLLRGGDGGVAAAGAVVKGGAGGAVGGTVHADLLVGVCRL
jgi:hypothetical protein